MGQNSPFKLSLFVRSRFVSSLLISASLLTVFGCSTQSAPRESAEPPNDALLSRVKTLTEQPLKPDETGEVLETAAGNFAYGPGLGETMLDVTGVVLFPPYAFVLAGNAALSLAGYQPIRAANLLPEEQREQYDEAMDTMYSGPGRVVSTASGKEYRDREEIKAKWDHLMESFEEKRLRESETPQPSFLTESPEEPRFLENGSTEQGDKGQSL